MVCYRSLYFVIFRWSVSIMFSENFAACIHVRLSYCSSLCGSGSILSELHNISREYDEGRVELTASRVMITTRLVRTGSRPGAWGYQHCQIPSFTPVAPAHNA